ncbi:Alb1-domain-containing protein [Nemania serpens]|nr:Alb1-domain-containing protein [Nemania serpens]
MAKGVITKKKKAPSLHSRAARRATSPGIDTDKSLKNVQPPPESVDNRPSILAIRHGAGVTKRQNKGRAVSSRARKRHEKAQDRAAALIERTAKKVALSKDQSRTIQGRRKVWEEVNQNIPLNNNSNSKGGAKRKGRDDDEGDSDESEFDDEMDGVGGDHGSRQQGDADKVDMTRPATEPTIDQGGDGDGDGIL